MLDSLFLLTIASARPVQLGGPPGASSGSVRGTRSRPRRCTRRLRRCFTQGDIVHTFIWTLWLAAGAAVVVAAFSLVLSGLRIIGERQAGLIIKRFGRPLPAGRLVALDGEAGLQ